MPTIPDITDNELWIVRTTLKERYRRDINLQLADSEIRLRPSDKELTECPVFYWEVQNCHFIIFKTGDRRYRSQFYYRLYQQMGTGIPEYDDLSECIVSLLQVQADHQMKERGKI